VTAHAMAGDRETFLVQSGADGYISKPVENYTETPNNAEAVGSEIIRHAKYRPKHPLQWFLHKGVSCEPNVLAYL
jgi:hypothetical protein